jgi:DnaJ-class molecular chaperone
MAPPVSPDHYEILGVDHTATDDQLRTAWRDAARRLHPDNDSGSSEEFIAAKAAYDVLADPARRRAYDAERMAARLAAGARRQSPLSSEPASPPDHPAPAARATSTEWGEPGGDLATTATISFSAAVFGTSTSVVVTRRDRCRTCGGTPPDKGCRTCGQDGYEMVEYTAHLDVSPGTTTGTVITIFAGGDVGERAGVPGARRGLLGAFGDLLVEVIVTPAPGVLLVGTDLIYDFPVDVIDAMLGAIKHKELLDGLATVVVPPGSVSGQRIKLTGRGVPVPGLARGDAYLEVRLEVRTDLTAAQRTLLESLRPRD